MTVNNCCMQFKAALNDNLLDVDYGGKLKQLAIPRVYVKMEKWHDLKVIYTEIKYCPWCGYKIRAG